MVVDVKHAFLYGDPRVTSSYACPRKTPGQEKRAYLGNCSAPCMGHVTRRRSGGIKLGAAGNNGNKKGGAKKQRTGASKRRQSAGSGDGNAEPEVLEQLLAMGFERRIALQALEENDNKLQEATEWIMLNAC